MREHGYGEAPRSACTFCPFHSDTEWLRLKEEEPDAFAHAVAADAMLRTHPTRHTGTMFVHRSLVPLDEIDFKARILARQNKHGQQPLPIDSSFEDECSGVCGV